MPTCSCSELYVTVTGCPITLQYNVAVDGNGNVVDVLDENGTSVASYEYTPFGRVFDSAGSFKDANKWRFSTKLAEDDWGLIYFGYRYYQPDTSRWVRRDPMRQNVGINPTAFCRNDPISRVDLFGLLQWNTLTPLPEAVVGFNASPLKGEPKVGYKILTDTGTVIEPSASNPYRVAAYLDGDFNCHSYTFDGINKAKFEFADPTGRIITPFTLSISFFPDTVADILVGDHWKTICCAAASSGDIVVFAKFSLAFVDHSAKIEKIVAESQTSGKARIDERASRLSAKRCFVFQGGGAQPVRASFAEELAHFPRTRYTCFTKRAAGRQCSRALCCEAAANERPGPAILAPKGCH